ncbi:hypothetical protein BLM14_21495 (plasmid) [Phyllobacterium zundukense]|nr:hypothetical protein BLM14_21495 [Phyllobacterium zundukense]
MLHQARWQAVEVNNFSYLMRPVCAGRSVFGRSFKPSTTHFEEDLAIMRFCTLKFSNLVQQ